MADGARKVRTAIVLQGGGARGAYELGVLKALYEHRPGFRPSVVSGTSIGAITAAVLAGAKGNPIEALERLWREKLALPPRSLAPLTAWWPAEALRSLAYLGNPGMYQVRPSWLFAPYASTSVYDTTPLCRTLAELADPERLNADDIRVIVGATNLGTGQAEFFDNSKKDLTFEKVVASASLPPGFPMTEVEGQKYWDGGLFTNLPLSPAINALEECDGGDPSVLRELIVVELFPMQADIPGTMPQVLDRMTQLQYTSRLVLDQHFFRKIGALVDLVNRVDQALPPDSDIRNDELYQKMLEHRKIDRFSVVTADFAPELASARDFTAAAIDGRIQAGYEAAMAHGIGAVDGGRIAV